MAGRAQQSFKKRQKEHQRKEKQQMKFAKRLQKKHEGPDGSASDAFEIDTPELQTPAAEEPAKL